MAKCLDLRKMATDQNYTHVMAGSTNTTETALRNLYDWLESRFDGAGNEEADALLAEYAMPPFSSSLVPTQFQLLASRLRAAMADLAAPFAK